MIRIFRDGARERAESARGNEGREEEEARREARENPKRTEIENGRSATEKKKKTQTSFDLETKLLHSQQLSSRVIGTDEPIIAVMRSVVAEASSSNSDGPVASLAQGAVWWQPPRVALAAAAAAALDDAERSSAYGDDMGLPDLRAALLRKCERDHGLCAKSHAAMVSAGANLAVSALALALLDSSSSASKPPSPPPSPPASGGAKRAGRGRRTRKDAAVLFPPYYFNARMAVQLAGAEVVLGRSDEGTWLPDVAWLERRLREEDEEEEREERGKEAAGDDESPLLPRIRMVYLVNPGNPSGVVVPFELLRRLVEACSGKGRRSKRAVFLVLDSTYEAFAPQPPPPALPASSSTSSGSSSCAPSPPFPLPSAPHVIHVGSFSKAFGAAGWRVGYVVYPIFRALPRSEANGGGASAPASSAVVDLLGPQLLKIQDTLPIHAAIASQRLAQACLEGTATGAGAGTEEAGEGETRGPPGPAPPSPSFGREWVAEKVAGLAPSRRAAEAALAHLGPGSRVWGEGAIYLWARLPPPPPTATGTATGGGGAAGERQEPAPAADDRGFVRFCVSRHGVAVIPGSACGVPGCVRVAFGRPRPGPEFEEAAARLARACRAWVAGGSEEHF